MMMSPLLRWCHASGGERRAGNRTTTFSPFFITYSHDVLSCLFFCVKRAFFPHSLLLCLLWRSSSLVFPYKSGYLSLSLPSTHDVAPFYFRLAARGLSISGGWLVGQYDGNHSTAVPRSMTVFVRLVATRGSKWCCLLGKRWLFLNPLSSPLLLSSRLYEGREESKMKKSTC